MHRSSLQQHWMNSDFLSLKMGFSSPFSFPAPGLTLEILICVKTQVLLLVWRIRETSAHFSWHSPVCNSMSLSMLSVWLSFYFYFAVFILSTCDSFTLQNWCEQGEIITLGVSQGALSPWVQVQGSGFRLQQWERKTMSLPITAFQEPPFPWH